MSFIINNEISFADSQNLDAFGRLRVSQPETIFAFAPDITSGSSYFETFLSGGTVLYNSDKSDITFIVTSNGNRALRQQHGYNFIKLENHN